MGKVLFVLITPRMACRFLSNSVLEMMNFMGVMFIKIAVKYTIKKLFSRLFLFPLKSNFRSSPFSSRRMFLR